MEIDWEHIALMMAVANHECCGCTIERHLTIEEKRELFRAEARYFRGTVSSPVVPPNHLRRHDGD